MKKDRLITILGPTASGKTDLSIYLAKALGSSIISGDAFQIYRHMDIGTAKVTKEEARGVPHYLVDELEPSESYSAADFQEKAKKIIHRENEAGRIPIVCGGTGLYIQGLLEGYSFLPKGKGRSQWETLLEEKGKEALIQALEAKGEKDIPPDPQRMVRKLELLEAGEGMEKPKKADSLLFDGPVLGIAMDRAVLYDRINKRVHLMIEAGLLDEVRHLLASGLSESTQALKGIGYKELIPVVKGERTLEEGEALIQKNTRHFAKRQLTWYRRMPYIHWVERGPSEEDIWYREIKAYVISYFRGENNDGR
ncbi:tRNA (adenosine(37)-N6)-dimethylallyltransferase MiaA [uncultured Dialister sp.]|jgi:tRNA dimethylallyltransferase|uniref:tRNA (adenosine(37)-N6)-dimethylallyltransferase MiaA n=1 Tax=uncultured Dialister sp. TaxID=278064 RepID=UPI0025EB2C18|nr:tRNA (adenosine(37)-N6)-dimethylallyltransferase MiaA [uncultured Dialister sp.]